MVTTKEGFGKSVRKQKRFLCKIFLRYAVGLHGFVKMVISTIEEKPIASNESSAQFCTGSLYYMNDYSVNKVYLHLHASMTWRIPFDTVIIKLFFNAGCRSACVPHQSLSFRHAVYQRGDCVGSLWRHALLGTYFQERTCPDTAGIACCF